MSSHSVATPISIRRPRRSRAERFRWPFCALLIIQFSAVLWWVIFRAIGL